MDVEEVEPGRSKPQGRCPQEVRELRVADVGVDVEPVPRSAACKLSPEHCDPSIDGIVRTGSNEVVGPVYPRGRERNELSCVPLEHDRAVVARCVGRGVRGLPIDAGHLVAAGAERKRAAQALLTEPADNRMPAPEAGLELMPSFCEDDDEDSRGEKEADDGSQVFREQELHRPSDPGNPLGKSLSASSASLRNDLGPKKVASQKAVSARASRTSHDQSRHQRRLVGPAGT